MGLCDPVSRSALSLSLCAAASCTTHRIPLTAPTRPGDQPDSGRRFDAESLPAVGLDQARVEPTSATGRRAQTHKAVQHDGSQPVTHPRQPPAPTLRPTKPVPTSNLQREGTQGNEQAASNSAWHTSQKTASKRQMAGRDDERIIESRPAAIKDHGEPATRNAHRPKMVCGTWCSKVFTVLKITNVAILLHHQAPSVGPTMTLVSATAKPLGGPQALQWRDDDTARTFRPFPHSFTVRDVHVTHSLSPFTYAIRPLVMGVGHRLVATHLETGAQDVASVTERPLRCLASSELVPLLAGSDGQSVKLWHLPDLIERHEL